MNNLLNQKFLSIIKDSDEFIKNYLDLLSSCIENTRSISNCPFIIEFLGTPEAGKTSTIKILSSTLPLKVKYLRESAEIVPKYLKKDSLEAHFWMQLNTTTSILEALKTDNQSEVFLIDRGISDTLLWNKLFVEKGLLSRDNSYKISCILESLLPNHLVVLHISPEECIRRKGCEGRIVTKAFIKNYNKKLSIFCDEFSSNIPTFQLDTERIPIEEVCELIKKDILEYF